VELTLLSQAVSSGIDHDLLKVTVVPSRPLPEQAPITIGRISIYRVSLTGMTDRDRELARVRNPALFVSKVDELSLCGFP
jgi:hypothetical protein